MKPERSSAARTRLASLLRFLPALVALGLATAAVFVLRRELRDHSFRELRATVRALPPVQVLQRDAAHLLLLLRADRLRRARADGSQDQAPLPADDARVVPRLRLQQQHRPLGAGRRSGALARLPRLRPDDARRREGRRLLRGVVLARTDRARRRDPHLRPRPDRDHRRRPAAAGAGGRSGRTRDRLVVRPALPLAARAAALEEVRRSSCRRRFVATAQIVVSIVDWTLAAAVLYVLLPDRPGAHLPALPRHLPRRADHRAGEPRARRARRLRDR